MHILVSPYDIATCSIAARGALLLGQRVLAAFPDPESLLESGLCTKDELVRTLGWVHPASRHGLIAFDQESAVVWGEAVAVRQDMESEHRFGSFYPEAELAPDPNERARRMAADVLRGGRDSWSSLAQDIAGEEYAERNEMILARVRSGSRSGQIEHSLGETLFRFTLEIPGEQFAPHIPELRDRLGHCLDTFCADAGVLIRSVQHGCTPPAGDVASLRSASGRLNDEISEIARSEGWGVQHTAAACVRYPAGITELAARAALGATFSSTDVPPNGNRGAFSTIALLFKPIGSAV